MYLDSRVFSIFNFANMPAERVHAHPREEPLIIALHARLVKRLDALTAAVHAYAGSDLRLQCAKTGEDVVIVKDFKHEIYALPHAATAALDDIWFGDIEKGGNYYKATRGVHMPQIEVRMIGTMLNSSLSLLSGIKTRTLDNHKGKGSVLTLRDGNEIAPKATLGSKRTISLTQIQPFFKPSKKRTAEDEHVAQPMLKNLEDCENNRAVSAILAMWSTACLDVMELVAMCVNNAEIDQYTIECPYVCPLPRAEDDEEQQDASDHVSGENEEQASGENEAIKTRLMNPDVRAAIAVEGVDIGPEFNVADITDPRVKSKFLQRIVVTKDEKNNKCFTVPYRADTVKPPMKKPAPKTEGKKAEGTYRKSCRIKPGNVQRKLEMGANIGGRMKVKDGDKCAPYEKIRPRWNSVEENRKWEYKMLKKRRHEDVDITNVPLSQIDMYAADAIEWFSQNGIPPQTPIPPRQGQRALPYIRLVNTVGEELQIMDKRGSPQTLNTKEYDVFCGSAKSPYKSGSIVLATFSLNQHKSAVYANLEVLQSVIDSGTMWMLDECDEAPAITHKHNDVRALMAAFMGKRTGGDGYAKQAEEAGMAREDDDYELEDETSQPVDEPALDEVPGNSTDIDDYDTKDE